uniref:Uncharacterized protein n=1 Tax=Clytia hemisphaerica TaxID=252671 RepID=A0A7M5XHW2_9CNID
AFHLVDYCQQVGRAGRDGSSKCHAILYSFPHHAHVSRSMKKFVTEAKNKCLRSTLYTPFNENCEKVEPLNPGHSCCSFCALSCDCDGGCDYTLLPKVEEMEICSEKKVIRNVSDESKNLVREMLVESHEQQSSLLPLLTPPELVTGLSETVIESVVQNL